MSEVSHQAPSATGLRLYSGLLYQARVVDAAANAYTCVSPAFARYGAARALTQQILTEWSGEEVHLLCVLLESADLSRRAGHCRTLKDLRGVLTTSAA